MFNIIVVLDYNALYYLYNREMHNGDAMPSDRNNVAATYKGIGINCRTVRCWYCMSFTSS